MRWITLPFDYARCGAQDCPLEKTCMRKTPGRDARQSMFFPKPSKDCPHYIHPEGDDA